MADRSPHGQSIHDAVISARESAWKNVSGYAQSWTNPGTERRWLYKLNGVEQVPDIIIQFVEDGQTKIGLEEVETVDTVAASEVQQWKNYAALNVQWLILVVPQQSIAEARRLAKGINLWVVGYSRDGFGNYSFSDPQAPDK